MATKEKWAKCPSLVVCPGGANRKLSDYNEKKLAGKWKSDNYT
jgi:hypothetical protein